MSAAVARSCGAGVIGLLCLLFTCAARGQERADATADQSRERVEVADLDLIGVGAVDESELRDALETRESPWLPWREPRYFDPETFANDLTRIVEFYADRGYPHARVVESAVTDRDGNVALRIVVDEGQPVRAAEVVFTGFDDVIPASALRALRDASPLDAGDPLALAAIRETAQLAAGALGNAGFAYARIEARQVPVEPDRMRIEFHAEPGQRGTFGPIQIAGNASIDDEVIRRELSYLPGRPFNAAALRLSQRRLIRLGLFESVLVEVANPDRPRAEVPTRVTVEEADLNQFGYSFGYGTEEQVNAEAQWRHLNLFGGGRVGTIRGRWSAIDRGGEGTFVQPYLFTPTLTLQLNGYAWQLDEPFYTVTSRGGSSSLSYGVGPLTVFTGTYLLQHESSRIGDDARSDGQTLLTALGLDAADGSQNGVLSAARFDASRDTTVDLVSPRSGYRAFFRIEKAGGWLPGSFTYRNVFAMGRYYHATGPLTLAGRLQFGSIVAERDEQLPFSKRYFLGGADSLRGWGRLEVSPRSASGVPVGGRSVLALSGELRFPLVAPVSAVTFVDAGNVWADSWELRLGNLRSNVGAGVRVNSPFGLLRLDIGYQLTPIEGLRVDGERQDRRWRMHFSAGQAF